ncbi:MAG: hypothetical protein LUO94_07975 [Methylococcaceae bacterium]|nr:hypothetical protein [Methylococcaceae bacterium]
MFRQAQHKEQKRLLEAGWQTAGSTGAWQQANDQANFTDDDSRIMPTATSAPGFFAAKLGSIQF